MIKVDKQNGVWLLRCMLFACALLRPVTAAANEAGTVLFPTDRKLAEGERIRLVSLTSPTEGESLRPLFIRDVLAADGRVRMPAGRIVALHLDAKERVIAALPPIVVRANEESVVWPEADPAAATLVARLSRPRAAPVALRATDAAGTHDPLVMVNGADAVFAVWYGLAGNSARLVVDSKELRLARDSVDLARGSVSVIDEALRVLPSLTVSIGSWPPDVEHVPALMLSVARASHEETALRTIAVKPGEDVTLELLPAELLAVDLAIGGFRLRERANLTSGENATLSIPLEPLTIRGTVFLGDTPTRATLRFRQKGEPLVVDTDDRGEYEATLWQPQRILVETLVAGRSARYSELIDIAASGTIDIHVPANELRVRVYDAEDGKALDRGEIVIHNRTGEQSSVTAVDVQAPETPLPPQRSGSAEIRVRAAGYADAGPILIQIDDGLETRVLDIPMTRSRGTNEVLVLLHNGAPAAGAELAAWSGEELLWSGKADDAGRIAVPESVARTRVIVRHPAAASELVVFGTLGAGERITLHPAAPPLVVEVVARDGKRIGPAAARMTLVRGVRLSGPEAAFATWSLGATAPDGVFIAKGLQAKAVRMFATRTATAEQIATGTFDGLATTIPYPWPALAKVTLVDR